MRQTRNLFLHNNLKEIQFNRQGMFSDCVEPGRRNMTISVTVLAVALMTVMMAYLAFGDNNDQETLTTLRLVGIVSVGLIVQRTSC